MAQRLGERVRGPTEATGLYRAVLLRSGKWRQVSPAPASGRARGGYRGRTALSLWPAGRRGPSLLCFPSCLPSFIHLITFVFLSFLLSSLHSFFWESTLRYIALSFYMIVWCAHTHNESWTVKKAEHRRIDVFELWCWRRLFIESLGLQGDPTSQT